MNNSCSPQSLTINKAIDMFLSRNSFDPDKQYKEVQEELRCVKEIQAQHVIIREQEITAVSQDAENIRKAAQEVIARSNNLTSRLKEMRQGI